MSKKTYSIPITWESYKRIEVEAESLQEATEIALKQFISEPDDEYLDDSWRIDSIIEDDYPDEDYDNDLLIKNVFHDGKE